MDCTMLSKNNFFKTATLTWQIGRKLAEFSLHHENRPFKLGRIGRKMAEFWPVNENRQLKSLVFSKSAIRTADFIARIEKRPIRYGRNRRKVAESWICLSDKLLPKLWNGEVRVQQENGINQPV